MAAQITLKFINAFRDRHGKLRYYFRRPGNKAVALPGFPGSADFMDAYQAALERTGGPAEIGASRTQAGTINALIVAYYKDESFNKHLAPETQRMRRNVLDRFREVHGDKRIKMLQRGHVVALLSILKPHARKNWLKALRALMAFAVAKGMRADDPTAAIKVKTHKSLGHMTWGDAEIYLYRQHHKVGTVARLALELLLNVAARRGDAHTLGRQHVRNGRLVWRPHKTLRSTAKQLAVKVIPDLQAALDALPATDSLTFLVTDQGKPFASAAAFGNKFADWCKAAGLQPVHCDDGRVRSYRAHGLRKAACRAMAHNGCTAPEIMAVSGHSTLAQVQVYIAEVEQVRMADAAIDKWRSSATKPETSTYKPSASRLQTEG